MNRRFLPLVGVLLILSFVSVVQAKVTDVWVVFKTHCDIGYTDTVHLAPAYLGALLFSAGIALCRKPMCRSFSNGKV